MMQFHPRHMEKHFQRNYQRHAFAKELVDRIQQLREYFAGSILPLPKADVIAAWTDVPNATTDIMPMSMKTEFVVLQVPPPTPSGLALDTDDAASSRSSSSNDSWVFVEDVNTPSPDTVACTPAGSSTTSDDSMSLCDRDQCSEKQNIEKDVFQSTDSSSPSSSSGHRSLSSGDQTPSTPVGFGNMVNQWFLDYKVRGTDAFVEALIAFGVVSLGAAPLASQIARGVIRRVSKMSYVEGRSLENILRFSTLTSFKNCWESGNDWSTSRTPHGVCIASLIGALFDEKISTARDIHLCLSYLLEGERRFDRLCAMHALMAHANDKLCKSRNFSALMEFKREITSRDEASGEYLWITTPNSKAILADILTTIERWTASQAVRREQSRRTTENCTVRNRAVGPRLRGDPVVTEPPVL